MKIVVFTGGTGSIALQRGFFDRLESRIDGVDIKIVVNAYDNGLSTGAVRRVMSGEILGPSDVRKNHVTRLRMMRRESPWLSFLSDRINIDAHRAHGYCLDKVTNLVETLPTEQGTERLETLHVALDEYFNSPGALAINYADFSLANILYAGLAKANDNSLRAAAKTMAELMGIPDRVLLNDDKSLFLGAITRSGRQVADEAVIVSWDNGDDPFVDVYFTDADGKSCVPRLCFEAWRAIVEADLIILSSGTLWSSLIPTYASEGFTNALRNSKAKVLMVMNRVPDRDSPGQTASDIIDILVPRYFDAGLLHVLADDNGSPQMRGLNQAALAKVASYTQVRLSTAKDSEEKHNPDKLFEAVGHVFFRNYLESDCYLFDYDGTVVGRRDEYPKSSSFNVQGIVELSGRLNMGICTGNTIRALNLSNGSESVSASWQTHKPLVVFADGGINEYSYELGLSARRDLSTAVMRRCVFPDALLPTDGPYSAVNIISALHRAGIPPQMIENRGGAVIAIRPVEAAERRALLCFIRQLIDGSGLEVRETGRTTLEICMPSVSKTWALKDFRARSPVACSITYVGDEFDHGNDHDVRESMANESTVSCLQVDSPAKTAFFISTLIAHSS